VTDRQHGEHDRQVGLDGFAFVVVDGPGLQVVFGHAEALVDAPQLVVGVDDQRGADVGEIGGVAPARGQAAVFGLQVAVDALGRSDAPTRPFAADLAWLQRLPARGSVAVTCSSPLRSGAKERLDPSSHREGKELPPLVRELSCRPRGLPCSANTKRNHSSGCRNVW
jgi:hypothetical protein